MIVKQRDLPPHDTTKTLFDFTTLNNVITPDSPEWCSDLPWHKRDKTFFRVSTYTTRLDGDSDEGKRMFLHDPTSQPKAPSDYRDPKDFKPSTIGLHCVYWECPALMDIVERYLLTSRSFPEVTATDNPWYDDYRDRHDSDINEEELGVLNKHFPDGVTYFRFHNTFGQEMAVVYKNNLMLFS